MTHSIQVAVWADVDDFEEALKELAADAGITVLSVRPSIVADFAEVTFEGNGQDIERFINEYLADVDEGAE
mgnify:CR=1 FL=1